MNVQETQAAIHAAMQEDFGLAYGRSGTGKSTWLAQMVEFLYSQTGKPSLIYCGDGGAATYHAMGLVDDGLAKVWDYTEHPDALYIAKKVTEGFLPENLDNPESKLVATDPSKYAGYFFEGLTVIADYLLQGLAERAAKGEKMGEDAPYVLLAGPKDDVVKIGGNSRSSFGTAQGRIRDSVLRSKRLRQGGAVVMWTAHERMVEDKEDNETIIGPACAGKALTTKVGEWFSNMVHMTTATKKGKKKDPLTGKDVDIYEVERRAYTREHGDPDGTVFKRYLANTRVGLKRGPKGELTNPMPEYLSPPDPIAYYQLIVEAAEARKASRQKVGAA